MNHARDVPSSRGFPNPEASAPTESSVNVATSPVPRKPASDEIQVMRLPQTLSLRVDGLNAVTVSRGESDANEIDYIESSERGSDTSAEGPRPELQSANTLTDSLSSLPSISMNGASQSMDLDSPNTFSDKQGQENSPDSHETPRALPVKGDMAINGQYAVSDAFAPEKFGNGSLTPQHQHTHSVTDIQLAPGQKRTVDGDVKSVSSELPAPSSSINGTTRRRSKSTGSPAYGSRIAQLSVHIRTRLSYAAAKVEKSRQLREADSQLGIPNSLLGHASNSTSNSQDLTLQTSASNTPHAYLTHSRSQSELSPTNKLFPTPKLAPPADIVSSNGDSRRRRPNPNAISKPSNHSPRSRHRRYHSIQDPLSMRSAGSPTVLGPETPSLKSPAHFNRPTSSQNGFYRSQAQSQNTSMEQDAIETLLFMSSPENSGYRSSPRPLQSASTQNSLNASLYGNGVGAMSGSNQSSQSSNYRNGIGSKGTATGLETHAGDEIDRILDQMESDSEDEGRFTSYHHGRIVPQDLQVRSLGGYHHGQLR
ncbi:hypothetical protein N7510_006425 [Penicillium lagena]|uniref:uncharacterized protein n=1 Tax=Penicillium lagena TaxID=94218 RepID=UPI002540F5E5|nr:uncharacterized protein N7510_006425 [Penicillium lagena]KAJ5613231.1 hypothetical protein N7510_006425 [Penicillium lagena]